MSWVYKGLLSLKVLDNAFKNHSTAPTYKTAMLYKQNLQNMKAIISIPISIISVLLISWLHYDENKIIYFLYLNLTGLTETGNMLIYICLVILHKLNDNYL